MQPLSLYYTVYCSTNGICIHRGAEKLDASSGVHAEVLFALGGTCCAVVVVVVARGPKRLANYTYATALAVVPPQTFQPRATAINHWCTIQTNTNTLTDSQHTRISAHT